MNKLKYIPQIVVAIAITGIFSLHVNAQRGGHSSGGGGGSRSGGGGGSFTGGNSSSTFSRGATGSTYRSGGGGTNNFRPDNGGTNNFHAGNGASNNIRPANGSYRPNNNGSYRPTSFTPHYNGGNRTSISIAINSGYNNFGGYYGHGGYYNGGYCNFYPRYYYRPIYYSPFEYTHFGPAFGYRLGILPFGYDPFFIGRDPYYYYDGIYYRPYNDGGYEVTQPPLGAIVKKLPSGAKPTVINGQNYYELGGTFYEEGVNEKNKRQYVVVGTNGVINTVDTTQTPEEAAPSPNNNNNAAPQPQQFQQPQEFKQPAQPTPPQNANITQLPSNSKLVTIKQQKYYLAPSGIYYQEVIDANNNVSYQSVSSSSDGTVQNIN